MGRRKTDENARFDALLKPSQSGCLEYQGARDRDGYGRFWVGSSTVRAHRFALARRMGVPPGAYVLHRCDNPPCCNPEHLFLGTNHDNIADRHAKGRDASGDRNGRRLHPERYAHVPCSLNTPEHRQRTAARNKVLVYRGEHSGMAKLTDAQVANIRMLGALGAEQRCIGSWFGVSKSQVGNILRGESRIEPTPEERPVWRK